jgi:hypothetical protein
MPTEIYRRPWFWAAILALIAVLVFGIVIAASGPDRNAEGTTTVVQTPPPAPESAAPAPIIPVPPPSMPPVVSAPAPSPVLPERPAAPAPVLKPPPPQIVREKTVIIREKAPKASPPKPATPAPDPGSSIPPGPSASRGATDEFGATGLPKQVRYDDLQWQAAKTMTVQNPDQTLQQIGTTEDGTAIYVSVNAQEPYLTILCAVPDEQGKFVEYRKR